MYTALYRKKRPRTFKEIVGQPHIKRALINQLVAGQVSHAYLFCGTRGTGKTSAAKIFARAVNCLAPQNGEPCNSCELCENILAERCLDVTEIDAASNNGVENIRDLRDEVKYLPNMARYKVYIVDEVHMLSTSAFNALLKTLEEPPPYVIFILATTDPQKIPATILSRCQRYDFRRITAEQMTAALRGYLQGESVTFEDDALDYIAYHSDGAMRDALSLLDQCLSTGDALTVEKVRDLLGAVDRACLFEFTDALADKNTHEIIKIISNAMSDGRDVSQFAADLVRHFRDVLVAGLTDGGEFSAEVSAKFKEQASRIPRELLMQYINAFSEVQREMRFAPHKRTAFEVCALKICMPQNEAVMPQLPPQPQPQLPMRKPAMSPEIKQPVEKPAIVKPSGSFSNIKASWAAACQKFPVPIRAICVHCDVEASDGILKIFCDNETSRKLILSKQERICETLVQFFNLPTPPKLAIEVREAYNKPIETVKSPLSQEPPKQESPKKEPTRVIPDDWANFGQEVIGGENF
ncbi:MAG: DNA polymerase III subunit gamma/tau [Defluviitaleaceae bacterium]|nr:DNA polymerase III subunit gamma/tau [Defluviitaleaceae bacterium]